jgi:hypothetical protein
MNSENVRFITLLPERASVANAAPSDSVPFDAAIAAEMAASARINRRRRLPVRRARGAEARRESLGSFEGGGHISDNQTLRSNALDSRLANHKRADRTLDNQNGAAA